MPSFKTDNYYYLRQKGTGSVLHSPSDGFAQIDLWTTNNPMQQWKLEQGDDEHYYLTHKQTGFTLDCSLDDQARVNEKQTADPSQQWKLELGDEEHFYLTHKATGFALNCLSDGYAHINEKQADNPYQQWELIPAPPEIDTNSWMSQLPDSLRLDQIIMPGSHDAGMSRINREDIILPPTVAQTQGGSIYDQLSWGSRYFDIRVDYDHDELVTYHRQKELDHGFGADGQTLRDVFDGACDFLKANAQETVIFKISHIRDTPEHNPTTIKQNFADFLNSYLDKHIFYTHQDGAVNLAELTLGDLRGKLILVLDYNESIDPSIGRFRYKDGTGESTAAGAHLTVFDQYSNSDNYPKMSLDQLEKWQKYAVQGEGRLFLLSWTLTMSGGDIVKAVFHTEKHPSIKELADEAHKHLESVLYEHRNAHKPNIVYIDFLSKELAQCIVQHNFPSA